MTNKISEKLSLFAFGSGWGVPFSTSAPFPLKLDTWLRMAGIPFEFRIANDPGKGPKGKSPWIELGDVRMGDSTLIIEFLQARFGVDLDEHLDPRQRAQAITIQRMLEEHYHQCFEHQLFFGEGSTDRLKEFATTMPAPLCWLLPSVLKHTFRKQLYARGMGRHPEKVILQQGKEDLDALSELLADKQYFLGNQPSSIDACVFGFLGVSVYVEGNNPLYRYAASLDNLMHYCERMRIRYYPETLNTLPPILPVDAGSPAKGNEVMLVDAVVA